MASQEELEKYNEQVKQLKEKGEAKPAPAPSNAPVAKVKPHGEKTFTHSNGKKYQFIMPSAKDVRELLPNRKIVLSGDGGMVIDIGEVERLIEHGYVQPQPNLSEMDLAEYDELILAYRAFLFRGN